MRLELLLSFGTCSLAICATIGGFFGMNLSSGIENVPNLLWYVSGAATCVAGSVFGAFVISVRRFHLQQQQQVESTAALDRAVDALDTAYFALRQMRPHASDGRLSDGGRDDEPELLPITREALRKALMRSKGGDGGGHGDGRLEAEDAAIDDLWHVLDADGDGVLTQDELQLGERLRKMR